MTQARAVVVVVEDEPMIRMVVVEALTSAGYQVIEAEQADDALSALAEQHSKVSVVVTDINMPGTIDGLTLAHRVRQNWPQIGVVIASGKMNPASVDLPPGAVFLEKPYSLFELVRHVSTIANID